MKVEYYIKRIDDSSFRVTKFEGNETPSNVYQVKLLVPGQPGYKNKNAGMPEMHCDCPNVRRAAHINDKHGRMVAKWLVADEPEGAVFNENYELIEGVAHGKQGFDGEAEGGEGAEDDEGHEEHG